MPDIEGVDLPETIPCRSGGITGGGCDEDESKVNRWCFLCAEFGLVGKMWKRKRKRWWDEELRRMWMVFREL